MSLQNSNQVSGIRNQIMELVSVNVGSVVGGIEMIEITITGGFLGGLVGGVVLGVALARVGRKYGPEIVNRVRDRLDGHQSQEQTIELPA